MSDIPEKEYHSFSFLLVYIVNKSKNKRKRYGKKY